MEENEKDEENIHHRGNLKPEEYSGLARWRRFIGKQTGSEIVIHRGAGHRLALLGIGGGEHAFRICVEAISRSEMRLCTSAEQGVKRHRRDADDKTRGGGHERFRDALRQEHRTGAASRCSSPARRKERMMPNTVPKQPDHRRAQHADIREIDDPLLQRKPGLHALSPSPRSRGRFAKIRARILREEIESALNDAGAMDSRLWRRKTREEWRDSPAFSGGHPRCSASAEMGVDDRAAAEGEEIDDDQHDRQHGRETPSGIIAQPARGHQLSASSPLCGRRWHSRSEEERRSLGLLRPRGTRREQRHQQNKR